MTKSAMLEADGKMNDKGSFIVPTMDGFDLLTKSIEERYGYKFNADSEDWGSLRQTWKRVAGEKNRLQQEALTVNSKGEFEFEDVSHTLNGDYNERFGDVSFLDERLAEFGLSTIYTSQLNGKVAAKAVSDRSSQLDTMLERQAQAKRQAEKAFNNSDNDPLLKQELDKQAEILSSIEKEREAIKVKQRAAEKNDLSEYLSADSDGVDKYLYAQMKRNMPLVATKKDAGTFVHASGYVLFSEKGGTTVSQSDRVDVPEFHPMIGDGAIWSEIAKHARNEDGSWNKNVFEDALRDQLGDEEYANHVQLRDDFAKNVGQKDAGEYYDLSVLNNIRLHEILNYNDDGTGISFKEQRLSGKDFLQNAMALNKRGQLLIDKNVHADKGFILRNTRGKLPESMQKELESSGVQTMIISSKGLLNKGFNANHQETNETALNYKLEDGRVMLKRKYDPSKGISPTQVKGEVQGIEWYVANHHLDGVTFMHPSLFDAMRMDMGLEKGTGALKASYVGGDKESGMFLGKQAIYKATPDMQEFMEREGVHQFVFDTSAKQTGKRKAVDVVVNDGKWELGYNNETPTVRTSDSISLEGFTNHSGGANGADTSWDVIGRSYGMTRNNHYYHEEKTPIGNKQISESDLNEGKVESAKAASRNFGYKYKTMKDQRLVRNWAQVKYSDSVFAIGEIAATGDKLFPNQRNDTRTAINPSVMGGTGYAVGMAINNKKPVYVFNQKKGSYDIGWYKYDPSKSDFVRTETPILTENFAGIGTREINEHGRKAIEEAYKRTIESQQVVFAPSKPIKFSVGFDSIRQNASSSEHLHKMTEDQYAPVQLATNIMDGRASDAWMERHVMPSFVGNDYHNDLFSSLWSGSDYVKNPDRKWNMERADIDKLDMGEVGVQQLKDVLTYRGDMVMGSNQQRIYQRAVEEIMMRRMSSNFEASTGEDGMVTSNDIFEAKSLSTQGGAADRILKIAMSSNQVTPAIMNMQHVRDYFQQSMTNYFTKRVMRPKIKHSAVGVLTAQTPHTMNTHGFIEEGEFMLHGGYKDKMIRWVKTDKDGKLVSTKKKFSEAWKEYQLAIDFENNEGGSFSDFSRLTNIQIETKENLLSKIKEAVLEGNIIRLPMTELVDTFKKDANGRAIKERIISHGKDGVGTIVTDKYRAMSGLLKSSGYEEVLNGTWMYKGSSAIKTMQDLLSFSVIRVPADSPSGTRILKFKGFTDQDGAGLVLNNLDMMQIGGADLDIDKAFFFKDRESMSLISR